MPLEIMTGFDVQNEPQRRRSARLSPTQPTGDSKMAPSSAAFAKRRITVRKIAPRKTTLAPSEHDKENTPRREASEGVQHKKQKISTPDDRTGSSGKNLKKSTTFSPIVPSPAAKGPQVQTRNQGPKVQTESSTPDKVQTRSSSSGKKKKKSTTLSPVVPSPIVPSPAVAESPKVQSQDPADEVWSQKVRRSYSRLSDRSLDGAEPRLMLFGFEKLHTPEVMRRDGARSVLEASGSLSALASFTTLLEAEDCSAEPDLNIPGVVVVKEKKRRRRKKAPQMDTDQMEQLAAKMNAEFEEAEEFELFVE